MSFDLVAPLGTSDRPRQWEGRLARKPWQYPATVCIPHLNTLDSLKLVIELLRLQTTPPYIVVVDTGSPWPVCEQLEALRAEDLEIHYVRAHGYIHSSAPVTTAMDVAWACVRTPYAIATHSDVYPRRRDLVEWILSQCDAACPVVGWEMSPRSSSTRWRGTPSHTFTAYCMLIMRRHGITWSMERWYEFWGVPAQETYGWPDTESMLRAGLDRWGIKPKILGPEPNFERHTTEWWDHARSLSGVSAGYVGADLAAKIQTYAAQAQADARARLEQWRAEVAGSRCVCSSPGFCPVYQRSMKGRLYDLCRSSPAYRELFRQEANAEKPSTVLNGCKDCGAPGEWTGEMVECETCEGRVQKKVFACREHGPQKGEG
jgi:hypothetical protein